MGDGKNALSIGSLLLALGAIGTLIAAAPWTSAEHGRALDTEIASIHEDLNRIRSDSQSLHDRLSTIEGCHREK